MDTVADAYNQAVAKLEDPMARQSTVANRINEFNLDLTGRRKGRRVGVPGGELLNLKSVSTIFRFTGSSFEATARCKWFWLHLVIFGIFCGFFHLGYPVPKLSPGHSSVLGSLLAFTLVFFNGQVYKQYSQRWQDIEKANNAVTTVCLNAAVHLDPTRAKLLIRYCIAQLHVFYNMMNGAENPEHYDYLTEMGLLNSDEQTYLQKVGGVTAGNVLCQWCVHILRNAAREGTITHHEGNIMRNNTVAARHFASKQIAYSIWPVPLIYLHAAAVMVHLYLIQYSWNTAVDFVQFRELEEYEAAAYCFVVHIAYTAMLVGFWWCGILMSQPFGHDSTDYDVMVELRGLWKDAKKQLHVYNDPTSPFVQGITEATAASADKAVEKAPVPAKGA